MCGDSIMMNSIVYRICPKHPETHLFEVQCIISKPNPKGQRFFLPAWIPGSYLIRDFSRHLVQIRAESNGVELPLKMLDKDSWECAPTKQALTISYQVFAYDLTPRGAHMDNTHAFFNGSRMFICVEGFEKTGCLLDILPPASSQYHHWQVATSMPAYQIDALGFGRYAAVDYDTLIDHPVEIGHFERISFEVEGIPHDLIITGKHSGDIPRLTTDLKRLCSYYLHFFGKPYPFGRYVFFLFVLKGGYGGIEHQNSTCLQASYENFPKINEPEMTEEYKILLALFSHEYFHSWNVKRVKPAAFSPYNLRQENYTRLLWVFEGITSYYDELALIRSGLITTASYLELLAKLITNVYMTPGRFKQTLEQSSFEAWTKFYRPDENTLNSSISYYTKGALVALALDLTLRIRSDGQHSLDEVMKIFWQRFGSSVEGVPEQGFELLVQEVSGLDLNDFFDQALRGVTDLPFIDLLKPFGVDLIWQYGTSVNDPGGKLVPLPAQFLAARPMLEVKLKSKTIEADIASVWSMSAAEASGLAPHDIIIAINGYKVLYNNLESMIARFKIGEVVTVHFFRRDELMSTSVKLNGGWLQTAVLKLNDALNEAERRLLTGWLGIEW